VPTLVGPHPDGTTYQLEGTLGEPPPWLVELLTSQPPRKRTRAARKAVAEGIEDQLALFPPPDDQRVTFEPEPSKPAGEAEAGSTQAIVDEPEDDASGAMPEAFDRLCKTLAEIDPKLGEVRWQLKEWEDRLIIIGRCPFEHDSGTSNDSDMHAGFHADGVPYIKCKHQSCTAVPEINRRLHEPGSPAVATEVDAPPLVLMEIAASVVRDLEDGRVALHRAPTGSGKSRSDAEVAVARYRLNQATVIAVPTIRLAREMLGNIEELAPDAVATGAVALICHRNNKVNEQEYEDEDDGPDSDYPIFVWTRIIICTHAQLMRRGYSKFIRGIYEALEPKEKETADGVERRPPFAFLIDEAPAFTAACHREIHFDHRVVVQRHPDRSGGRRFPIGECPHRNRSGSCKNCELVNQGGEPRFNSKFNIRELAWPLPTDIDHAEKKLRTPLRPLVVDVSVYTLGPAVRVGINTFGAQLLSWRGTAVDTKTRKTAPIFQYQADKDGKQLDERHHEIIGHMLEFAFRPVVTWEMAIDSDGNAVDPGTIKAKIELESNSSAGIGNYLFPWYTCQVRRLRFTDLLGLEKLRRFATAQGIGVAFMAATMTQADSDALREVWPELVERWDRAGIRQQF
jgi:hypothetical protein